jgi:hypothetical protein
VQHFLKSLILYFVQVGMNKGHCSRFSAVSCFKLCA